MNLVDLFIVLLAALAAVRGVRVGLLRQGFSLLGFFVGLFLGSVLAHEFASQGEDPLTRGLIVAIITFGLAFLLSGLGETLGLRLHRLADRFNAAHIDKALGAVFGGVAAVIAFWLLASIFSTLPSYDFSRVIKQSRIISILDQRLPPAPHVLSRLGNIISPNEFPDVFVGREPDHGSAQLPLPADIEAASAKAQPSVVKIEGLGCGGIVEGSGFVAATNLIATNAHVVAGIRQPVVIDEAGTHRATPIYFDPDLDFAVLRVKGDLSGAPLSISSQEVPRETRGAVLGYPGGRGYTALPAVVLDKLDALGRDIYGSGLARRTIYEVQSNIEQGNSGGPLVATDGTVIGMIFAESVTDEAIGYSLISTKVLEKLSAAKSRSQAVSTGACASE